MVSFDVWVAFTAAAALVLMTPGPSTMLALAHGFRFGRRRAAATVLGIVSADATHVAIVVVGLSALLALSVQVFTVLKWVGVAYLVWLGIRYWRSPPPSESAADDDGSWHRRWLTGYLVTITNPKPILFHVAFFPQFVDPALPRGPQLLLFGATFLVIALATLFGYAGFAGRVRHWFLAPRRARWLNRMTGTLLLGAGVLLAGLRRA